MEGKMSALEARVEGRMNILEGKMEATETTMDGLKVETVALRQEIKELTRVPGGQARNLDRHSEGSQVSVNEIR